MTQNEIRAEIRRLQKQLKEMRGVKHGNARISFSANGQRIEGALIQYLPRRSVSGQTNYRTLEVLPEDGGGVVQAIEEIIADFEGLRDAAKEAGI